MSAFLAHAKDFVSCRIVAGMIQVTMRCFAAVAEGRRLVARIPGQVVQRTCYTAETPRRTFARRRCHQQHASAAHRL